MNDARALLLQGQKMSMTDDEAEVERTLRKRRLRAEFGLPSLAGLALG